MKAYKNLLTIFMASVLMIPGYRANGAIMTNEIRGLMEEKERKMQELEKCDGKRKAFMIAGISTVGLTAVGVVGNVVLANKNKKLSEEINTKQSTLNSKQGTLDNLNNEINSKLLENANIKWQPDVVTPTPVIPKPTVVINYDGYTLACGSTTTLVFKTEDVNGTVFSRLDAECKEIGGKGLVESSKDTANGTTTFACVDESNNPKCKEAVNPNPDPTPNPAPTPKKVYDNPTCQNPRVTFNNATDDAEQIENIQGWCELQLQGNWTKISEQGGGVTYECKDSPVCQQMTIRTNCEDSGGTWRNNACFCGHNQQSSDKNMMLTNQNTCKCKTGYVYIDNNDKSKGCRMGSNQQAVDEFIQKVNAMQTAINNIDSKVGQLRIAVNNMSAAGSEEALTNLWTQAGNYAQEAEARVTTANQTYTDAMAKYNALSAEDKPRAASRKQDLDVLKGQMDRSRTEINTLKNKANTDYQTELNKYLASVNSPEAKNCVETGGKWETTFCRCPRPLVMAYPNNWCKPAN